MNPSKHVPAVSHTTAAGPHFSPTVSVLLVIGLVLVGYAAVQVWRALTGATTGFLAAVVDVIGGWLHVIATLAGVLLGVAAVCWALLHFWVHAV